MAEWTIRQALFCLVGSVTATLSLCTGGYLLVSKQRQSRLHDERYSIVSIVQTGPEKEALNTAYLAELLGLSHDRPTSLYAIDCPLAEKKLRTSPLIRSARVRRMPPSTLYIEYEVRKPAAMLADYKNTAIDEEGFIFPFAPFFSPKEIPEIYLGIPPFAKNGPWQVPRKNAHLDIALEILRFLEGTPWREGFRVKRIDVSNAYAASLGQREIVLFTEEEMRVGDQACLFPKILRVAPKDFARQLEHFFLLRRSMEESYRCQIAASGASGSFAIRIIDLRIPQLAFVQN